MDTQTFINVLMLLVAFFGGWMVKAMNDALKEVKDSGTALATKVQGIEVLVAGEYVKKDELKAIFDMLQRIDEKIDRKADK